MPDRTIPAIRVAQSSDCSLLSELGARTFADTFAADNKPEDMAAYLKAAFSPETIATELLDPQCTFLIVSVQETAAGYAMLRSATGPAEISGENPIEIVRLYVSKEWHGLGVGKILMQACIERARQEHHETLWLGVWEHNARALAFYRKWDFQEVGSHIFQLGGDEQKDILMQRRV